MDKSQPLAVKLTDDSARPAAKPAKAAKVATKLSGPSHQERVAAFQSAAGSAKVGKAPVEVEGLKTIAERQADMQQSQKTDAQQRTAVGSVKAKLEEFKAAAEATSAARSSQVQIEGQMTFEQRRQLFLQQTAKTEDREERKEAVKTGKVAEIAALLLQKKEVEKSRSIEAVGSLSEKMKAFQEAAKSSSDKGRSSAIEGLPSIKDRTQQLFTRTKAEDTRETVVVPGTLKDRLSFFTSGKAWRREGEESEEEEAEESPEEEPVQAAEDPVESRKSKAQQSLLEKYASKAPAKVVSKRTEDREEAKEEKQAKPAENEAEPQGAPPVGAELPAIEYEETVLKGSPAIEETAPVDANLGATVSAEAAEGLQLAPAEEGGEGAVVREAVVPADGMEEAKVTVAEGAEEVIIAVKEAEARAEEDEANADGAEIAVEGAETAVERTTVAVVEQPKPIQADLGAIEEQPLAIEKGIKALEEPTKAIEEAKFAEEPPQAAAEEVNALGEQPLAIEEEAEVIGESPKATEAEAKAVEVPKAIEEVSGLAPAEAEAPVPTVPQADEQRPPPE